MLHRFYGYTYPREWPRDIKPGCTVKRDKRLFTAVHDLPEDTVNEMLWTKMQYLVTVPINKTKEWNPRNHSLNYVFLAQMTKSITVAAVFDLTKNEIRVAYVDANYNDAKHWNQAYRVVNEQKNTKIVGQVYPPNSDMVFTATFGVFVVVDHDAGYEAIYTCYRDSGRFRKYPFNTLCEKFYDRRNIGRPILLGDNALTYIFLPGQEWLKCNEPYCSIASKYTVAEPLVGCTLYDRLTFEWVRWCVTTRCLGAKYDRPFETAQKIALAFKTESDKKKWKHDWR